MKIRFRKSGKVVEVTLDDQYIEKGEKGLIPPNMDGMDLTECSVIYVKGGRGAIENASALVERVKNGSLSTIVLWNCNYSRGWSAGIEFPADADERKIKFFQTQSLKEKIEREKKEEAMKVNNLQRLVEMFPGSNPRPGWSEYLTEFDIPQLGLSGINVSLELPWEEVLKRIDEIVNRILN